MTTADPVGDRGGTVEMRAVTCDLMFGALITPGGIATPPAGRPYRTRKWLITSGGVATPSTLVGQGGGTRSSPDDA